MAAAIGGLHRHTDLLRERSLRVAWVGATCNMRNMNAAQFAALKPGQIIKPQDDSLHYIVKRVQSNGVVALEMPGPVRMKRQPKAVTARKWEIVK